MDMGNCQATYGEDDQKQKVYVSNIMELVPQVLRDEAERRVLGGPDLVSSIMPQREAVIVHRVGWQGRIEEDGSRALAV